MTAYGEEMIDSNILVSLNSLILYYIYVIFVINWYRSSACLVLGFATKKAGSIHEQENF